MRRATTAFLIGLLAAALPAPGLCAERAPGAADWESLQAFYDAHEECRDFLPFGLFGYGGESRFTAVHQALRQFNSARTTTEMHLDSLVEHNFNSIWGGPLLDGSADPAITESDDIFYGKLLPRYEIRTLPSGNAAGFRADSPTFAGMQRREPPLTPAETAEAERRLGPQLARMRSLAETYPGSILGFVTDDEPENWATAVACARLVEKHTGKLATFTTPNFYNLQAGYSAQMMPITGDLYYVGDNARSSWKIPEQVRWLARNRPGRLFWLMPLASAWTEHEPTLPDTPDSRPLRTELRLQCWSALALGTKGFYFFQQGEWCFSWGQGQDGVFDVLKRENDHHPRQNLAAELREIGRDFTTIGPSLLRAYPALEPAVPIACEQVRFPSFRGPAVDCGLLRDPRSGRDFLVPWNNDIDHDQTGTLTVPAELLGSGRGVYDLHDLRPVALGTANSLDVSLPPGGGRIYLVGDEAAFAEVRESILRHRLRPLRVKTRSLLRRRDAWPKSPGEDPVDELVLAARAAEKDGDLDVAARGYRRAIDELRGRDPTAAIAAILDSAGAQLSAGDDLLRTHGRTLFDIMSRSYRGYGDPNQIFAGLPILPEVDRWITLAATYVSLQQQLYAGEVDWARLDRLKAAARRLAADAEANVAALKAKFAQRIKETRRPFRVAYVTADREGIEEIRTYAWAYRTFRVKWIAPDDEGVLRDVAGREFDPAEYDVVWIHQLLSRQPPGEEVRADPHAVLLQPLLEPVTRDAIRDFVSRGGGLLLTGVAGLYALPLGVETVPPDRFFENRSDLLGYKVKLSPAHGAEKHPAMAHVPPDGVITNGGHTQPGWCVATTCEWLATPPSGTTIGLLSGEQPGRGETSAAVEYALGRGKIMVLGGTCCSLTPGLGGKGPALPRQIALDVIGYLAGPERFTLKRPAAR